VVFNWDNIKNENLKYERGVSFEQIVLLIQEGFVLDILEHPQKAKYNNQKLYIIDIENYVYVVPFVDQGEERFLKTIFPSRKYTKIYLSNRKYDDET
jgi:uncharacterized DUF497 family protein